MFDPSDSCTCKVGKAGEKYDLSELDSAIVTRREDDEASLRSLARFVNVRILDAVLDEAEVDVAGDATSVYEALTGEDVSAQRQATVRNRLVDQDIDVDALTADFVSYQVVRTHLRDCLGLDTGRRGITTVTAGREVVVKSRQRSREVIERSLRRLQRVGTIEETDISVTVSVRVRCDTCGGSYTVDEYLDSGGCTCSQD